MEDQRRVAVDGNAAPAGGLCGGVCAERGEVPGGVRDCSEVSWARSSAFDCIEETLGWGQGHFAKQQCPDCAQAGRAVARRTSPAGLAWNEWHASVEGAGARVYLTISKDLHARHESAEGAVPELGDSPCG